MIFQPCWASPHHSFPLKLMASPASHLVMLQGFQVILPFLPDHPNLCGVRHPISMHLGVSHIQSAARSMGMGQSWQTWNALVLLCFVV